MTTGSAGDDAAPGVGATRCCRLAAGGEEEGRDREGEDAEASARHDRELRGGGEREPTARQRRVALSRINSHYGTRSLASVTLNPADRGRRRFSQRAAPHTSQGCPWPRTPLVGGNRVE